MDISRLVEKEINWLAAQEEAVRSELLTVYRKTFEDLRARLKALPQTTTYTRNQVLAIERQLAVILKEMERSQRQLLGKGVQQVFSKSLSREKRTWTKLEKTFGSKALSEQFSAFLPVVNQRAVKALVMTQGISIKCFSDELTKAVRQNVASSLLRGDGIAQTVRRLKEVEGAPKNKARLQLIARMETARASNEAKQDFIEQANKQFPAVEFWQLIRDRVDKSKTTRNHWFSWAISGTVRNVSAGELFEVSNASMATAKREYAALTRKKATDSGILWGRSAIGRAGKSIPAHYNDRACMLAWRPEWGTAQFGPIKHPQGKIPKPVEK